MRNIELNEIEKILDCAPTQMNTLFLGDTGIGKTQTIKKYCKDRGIFLKTLILSQIEASECLGIPVQSKREYQGKTYSTIEQALPEWVFSLAEHENCILYLDEFLCAEPAVMNSFLNFLSEKEVNGIDLSHVKVVASSNIGNYTFDPDSNILSRFCMFYVNNSSYKEYLTKKYKGNKILTMLGWKYHDETDQQGVLFEERSLKPRCQELLLCISDSNMIPYFYEGFTNSKLYPKFHDIDTINEIITTLAVKDGEFFYLKDDSIDAIATTIVTKYPKLQSFDKVCTFNNINYDKNKIIGRCTLIKNNRLACVKR